VGARAGKITVVASSGWGGGLPWGRLAWVAGRCQVAGCAPTGPWPRFTAVRFAADCLQSAKSAA
jgi:hypothetical protein